MFPRFDFPSFQLVRWITLEEVYEGQPAPAWYYGHAYSMLDRDIEVFAVIPLNCVIRFRKWYGCRWDRFRCRPSWIDREIRRQYRRGHQEGFRKGLGGKEEILESLMKVVVDTQAKKVNPILTIKH